MLALYEQLRNPLTRLRDQQDRERLASAFPELNPNEVPHILALRRYLDSCPERFMDRNVYRTYLAWAQDRDARDRRGLQHYLAAHSTELDQAIMFLREVNAYDWHDERLDPKDDYDLVRFIDQHIHPTYLRVVEAVMTPFARPVAHFSRLDRKKKPEGLDTWSVVQELSGGPSGNLCSSYVNTIRNGIGHGGITYGQREIQYRDKKRNTESFTASAIIRLLDDLLDACNGMAAALRVFFVTSREADYHPPREVLFEELLEETRTPWWTVEGCVDSVVVDKTQLVVYVRPSTRHVDKVRWSTIQTGILAEYFAPGFDRYFLSLRSPVAWPGWAAFDGQMLGRLREEGASSLDRYKGVLVDDLIFYVPQPALPPFLGKFDTFWQSFRINMPIAFQQFRRNLGIPRITCRGARLHRNGWRTVLNAEVVCEDFGGVDISAVIRKHRRRIVRVVHRKARKLTRHIAEPRTWPPSLEASSGAAKVW